ncbi:hypothetical protein GIB67_021174 [Kingdonia uniflora]|uniref:COPA/B TPR domain-containing protein n=1 Tax=Kingdonia uniflora TaxID=39325 RepID=A0A7J7N7A1_9MAGN|nr:hypothetical protein GIB67_021174 [Kingdonia uniflora]
MDSSGKIIWAKHNEIQTVNIRSVGADFEAIDGERLPLAVKELGSCDLYLQSLRHNPNGKFVVICGDGEYIIYTALAWRNRKKKKHLGELAMSTGKLDLAGECLQNAMDLSGMLVLYSSLGDAEGIKKLAYLAKEQGKNNVAFLYLFMLGNLEECVQLLVDSNRIPEAALMARSYLPSKVLDIVAIWKKEFDDWQVSLAVESATTEQRGIYPSALEYLRYKSKLNLVVVFKSLPFDEEGAPLENGESNHEAMEVGNEEDGVDEAIEVDVDSTDGAVLANSNEDDEEWGTNNEGTPPA